MMQMLCTLSEQNQCLLNPQHQCPKCGHHKFPVIQIFKQKNLKFALNFHF